MIKKILVICMLVSFFVPFHVFLYSVNFIDSPLPYINIYESYGTRYNYEKTMFPNNTYYLSRGTYFIEIVPNNHTVDVYINCTYIGTFEEKAFIYSFNTLPINITLIRKENDKIHIGYILIQNSAKLTEEKAMFIIKIMLIVLTILAVIAVIYELKSNSRSI